MSHSALIRNWGILALMIAVTALWMNLDVALGRAAQGQGPCADDVQRFCREVQPGGGRIVRCLKEHEDNVSPACRQQMAEVMNRVHEFHEFREVCQDDVLRLCTGVKPGEGRIVNCLKENKRRLSPECRAKIESREGQYK